MRAMQTTHDTESTIPDSTIEGTIDRYLVMWNEADDAVRSEQALAVWIRPSGANVTTSIPATATEPSGAFTVQPKRAWV